MKANRNAARETEKILLLPNIATPKGLRDRAIMELLYTSGLRRFELCALRIGDVDLSSGLAYVHLGKGRKQRYVPVGKRALGWIGRYLREARPLLLRGEDAGWLFLSIKEGGPMAREVLGNTLRRYVKQAFPGRRGCCHIFRHAMATHMLDRGADIRVIQEILGHEELSTTQIYTHVSIRRIQEVHAKTHPAKTKLGLCAEENGS